MNIKETIRAEIERRYNENLNTTKVLEGKCGESSVAAALFGAAAKEDYEMLSILDSLPEQSVDGLEEAAWDCVLDSVDVNNPVLLPKYKELLTYLFKAGAEWGRAKMLEGAVEGTIMGCGCGNVIFCDAADDYEPGTEVKLIIVKEDEK